MSQTVSPSISRRYGMAGSLAPGAFRAPSCTVFSSPRRRRRRSGFAPDRLAPVWMLNWRIISASKSPRPAFMARATGRFGPGCALQWGSRQPSTRPEGDGRKRLACAASRRTSGRENA